MTDNEAPRVYNKSETATAVAQGEMYAAVLTPKQRDKLLGVMMAKLILDEGHDFLGALIQRVQKTTR